MPDFEMDFEWPVASYRLGTDEEWPSLQKALGTLKKATPALDAEQRKKEFEATFQMLGKRANRKYREILGEMSIPLKEDLRIIAEGKAVRKRPTAKQFDSAIDLLVRQVPTKFNETALKVAKHLGLLMHPSEPWDNEWVYSWSDLANTLRIMLSDDGFRQLNQQILEKPDFDKGFDAGRFPKAADMDLVLISGPNQPPRVGFRPRTLRDALIFRAAQNAGSGTHVLYCENCNSPLLVGGARVAGRRKAGSRFCSDQCRWDFNNGRKKKA